MAGYPGVWALCGGRAVEAWLGRVTREHGDIDVSVFADDQRTLFDHLSDWQLLAHNPDAPEHDGEWWDGRRRLKCPSHIHARPPERSGAVPVDGIATAEGGFTLDIQINEADDDEWTMHREPRVSMSLERSVRESPWGMPAAVPEVLLFYKSNDMRMRDKLDFVALLPQLDGEQREWLRDAISRTGHPWLARLAD